MVLILMQHNPFNIACRLVLSLFLLMMLFGASPSHAEPEDASVYWNSTTQGLSKEITADPVHLRRLFGMPTDAMEEVQTRVRPPRSPKGWLGITMQEGPPLFLKDADDFSPTIHVSGVFPDSAAAGAGLQTGDTILAIDGQQLSIGEENSLMMNFRRRVQDVGAYNILQLKIQRSSQEMEIPVKLLPKPIVPETPQPPSPSPSQVSVLPTEGSLLYRILSQHQRLEDYSVVVEEIRERTRQAVTTAVKGTTYNPFRLRGSE